MRGLGRDQRAGQPPPLITASRSEISSSSSRSCQITSTAGPGAARSSSAWWIAPRRRHPRPRSAGRRPARPGSCRISRPTTNFCRLPPDRLSGLRPTLPGVLTSKRSIDLARRSGRAAAVRMKPAGRAAACAGRPSGRRSRSASCPAPRHGRCAPRARRQRPEARRPPAPMRPTGLPSSCTASAPATSTLARERRQQLVLAVAGDAGDAEDLAAAHLEADVLEVDAERLRRPAGSRSRTTQPARSPRRLARASRGVRSSLPTISSPCCARSPASGSQVATTLPPRRIVARVAQRPDLLELVADVEDRAALGRELAQRREQPLDLLRRQHRGRLVHDQQLRVLQQAADDLDPLPLADRERVHVARRVERQAVGVARPRTIRARQRRACRRRRPRRARCSPAPSAPRTARSAGTPCRCRGARAACGSAIAHRLAVPADLAARRGAARRRSS